MNTFFNAVILRWYDQKKRDLPWRKTKDPFKIWLSEVILQQTRVAQGLEYYLKFISNFKDVHELANADEDRVLKLWQGLGYYSRARNLHFTAKYISKDLHGIFPDTYSELIKLKGVGHYTASAISSFCFDEKVAVLDGNVFRVLSRFFGLSDPINSSKGEKKFRELSAYVLPETNVDSYNQGIMEFGALQCVPVNPSCEKCPLSDKCYALANNEIKNLPIKIKKAKVEAVFMIFVVLISEDSLVLRKREGKGIWQNLYEFPSLSSKTETETSAQLEGLLTEFKVNPEDFIFDSQQYTHLLSHRRIKAKFKVYKFSNPMESSVGELVNITDFENYPIHRLMDKFVEDNPTLLKLD